MTISEMRARLAAECGEEIQDSEVRQVLQGLDEAGYLEGPRARHRQAERRRVFHERPLRAAVHAGGSYPDDVVDLPPFLAAGFTDTDGPGSLPAQRDATRPTPRGVVAPHVDLHRGAPTYSWAYKALAEAQPAELYVVLGTCHTPVQGHFAATRKPYDTPLGPVPADGRFLDRLQKAWKVDLFQDEFAHAAEHSIEFQAVYLRSLGLAGEGAAPIVPILMGSLHSMVMPPYSPRDVAYVADFIEALQQSIAEDGRRITVVAAVDLAHVGPRFGDLWLADADHMRGVSTNDRQMLDLIASGDAEGYYQQVMRDEDARRICGFTPLYFLTELMQPHGEASPGELLRYTQWVAPDYSSSVTFASMLFR